MDRDLLIDVGVALYGAQWQTQLAEALGVADRTVRRWVAGQAIPAGVRDDLRALVHDRRGELAELAKRLG